MLLQTEHGQVSASAAVKPGAKATRRRDDDDWSFQFADSTDTGSYSAGKEERDPATILSVWLSFLRCVPVANMYASKTAKNVKGMHAGV